MVRRQIAQSVQSENGAAQTTTACGSGTTAAVGSLILEQCICNVGFYPFADTGSCTACPGGLTTRDIGSTDFADCIISVATSGIATAFASATDGDKLVMEPGTLTEGAANIQFSMKFKYVSIYCDTSSAETCTWKGATYKGVVYIYINGGTTTLGHIIIRDGDSNKGSGLWVYDSNALLVVMSFINNSASDKGGAIFASYGSRAWSLLSHVLHQL
ncbi:hypothetical protein ScalyP_jg4643 [Parmales sp. scaly parma]|nr:hypothetical protein ScalyP_jg4643 [Parmales sp. scaly parma]